MDKSLAQAPGASGLCIQAPRFSFSYQVGPACCLYDVHLRFLTLPIQQTEEKTILLKAFAKRELLIDFVSPWQPAIPFYSPNILHPLTNFRILNPELFRG